MIQYRYKAITKDGKEVKGVLTAYDESAAVAQIKETCDLVVSLEEVPETAASQGFLSKDLGEPTTINLKTLSLMCSQFAILLRAGLPLDRTVKVVEEQTTDKYLKKILKDVVDDTTAGYSMSQSFEARTTKMPYSFIQTLRAGEESGTIEESFAKLSTYYEKSSRISGKVKGALIYPAFLMALAVIVVIVVVQVAVPAIVGSIENGGGTVPGPTKLLLAMYNFTKNYWWVMLTFVLLVFVAFKLYKNSESGHMKLSVFSLNMPVIGKINRMNLASQFASTMVTMLSAGLPLAKCLETTGSVVDNFAAGRYIRDGVAKVEEGKRLEEVFHDSEYLPPLLVEMTGVGEESGALEQTLTTIGQYYDAEVEEATAKAMGILEPAITVFLGIAIGFVVIALYLPMFNAYG